MICDKCNGLGWIYDNTILINEKMAKTSCPKCYDKKEIDWLEDIFGVDEIEKWVKIDNVFVEKNLLLKIN